MSLTLSVVDGDVRFFSLCYYYALVSKVISWAIEDKEIDDTKKNEKICWRQYKTTRNTSCNNVKLISVIQSSLFIKSQPIMLNFLKRKTTKKNINSRWNATESKDKKKRNDDDTEIDSILRRNEMHLSAFAVVIGATHSPIAINSRCSGQRNEI